MRLLTLLALTLLSTLAFGQETKAAYLEAAAQHTCDCIQGEMKDAGVTIEMKLGTCMVQFISNDVSRYEAHFGKLDFSDNEGMTRIGEQLGVAMLPVCPDIMMELVENSGVLTEEPEVQNTVLGTVTDISDDTFVTVKVKTSGGPELRLLWLGYFTGEEFLRGDDLSGKTLEFTYEMLDLYNGKSGEYESWRVIQGVAVK